LILYHKGNSFSKQQKLMFHPTVKLRSHYFMVAAESLLHREICQDCSTNLPLRGCVISLLIAAD